jgi:short-subunit dehydrogenase
MSFANQVAIVTGASSGIGRALAQALAAEGCRVGLLARRRDELEALAAEIRQAGGVAACAVASVADRVETTKAIAALRDQLGPVDLLVACAGVSPVTELEPLNLEAIEETIRVNLLGVIYATAAVLPDMLQRGQGQLAAVSSLAGYKGFPRKPAYCASKAAVNTYLEGLRIRLRGRGIAVTTLCPGFVHTPMTDGNPADRMPWALTADQAACRMIEALRRGAKVYNFPWQTTLLMKLARWMPDWVVARVVLRERTRS